jgi:LacI family transcriptional regulator, galactose operon repressor
VAEKKINIRELARLSGVSVGTVSRALNGYPDVREQTRERVLALAEELEYTPDAAARRLVTRRSSLVGVFLETGEGHPDLQHPFFHEVLVGVKRHLGTAGYDLLLFASESEGTGVHPRSYLQRCLHHGVAGVVLMGVDADSPEAGRLARSALPVVSIDLELQGRATTWIASDSEAGAAQAVSHLLELGHERIGHIAGPLETTPGRARLRGFQRAIAANGVGYDDSLVAYGDYYFDSGQVAMKGLLALPKPPTAVFAASDMMAMGAIRAINAAGLSVPGDISIVGFDDIAAAAMSNPSLTTVKQDKQAVGAAAVEALLGHLASDGGADPASYVSLPVELVPRASTAPPK